MLSPETDQAAQEAGTHAGDATDTGSQILHHILDSHYIEVPFLHGTTIPLPRFEVYGYDLSITKHVVMMWIAGLIVLLLMRLAIRDVRNPVPGRLRSAMEVLILFVRDEVGGKSIPHHAAKFTGYLLSTFFFILACNLLGLVPFMATATGNISVTAGLAVLAFLVIQIGGLREFGPIRHFANLVPHGLPGWLGPLMFFLEFLSMFIKPFALCIRLFANMMAGHVVILAFLSLIFILGWVASPVAVFFALFVYFLEVLVAFIQAYIFTMLTAQFIGMSVHPAH